MTHTTAMSVTTFPWTTSVMGQKSRDRSQVNKELISPIPRAQWQNAVCLFEPHKELCPDLLHHLLPGSVEGGAALCQRRSCLPSPSPTNSTISLWNILRNNIGKDLSKVAMPVQLNEPLNTLQRLCEELEYSELLDRAANTQDPFERMVRRHIHFRCFGVRWPAPSLNAQITSSLQVLSGFPDSVQN